MAGLHYRCCGPGSYTVKAEPGFTTWSAGYGLPLVTTGSDRQKLPPMGPALAHAACTKSAQEPNAHAFFEDVVVIKYT